MRVLKIVIIILLIAIIGIVGLIFLLNSRNNAQQNIANINPSNNYITNEQADIEVSKENENVNNTANEYAPELTFNTTIQEVSSYSDMYSISQNINKYYNYINGDNIKFTAKKAFVTLNEYQRKYYIQGNLIQFTENSMVLEQEVYIVMYLDLDNNTYKVEESTIEQFKNKVELTETENIHLIGDEYNNYEYTYIDGARQLELYLEDYAFYLVNDINRSYNLLEEEYRAKRFKDINVFKEYALNNQNRFQNIEITQYNIINEDENTIYIGKDKDGNYHKVIVKSYMDYKIILDNYTIINEYDELDDDEKIKVNVERFISMLNSKDYTNAYNLLEPNFKETYFRTEQDFINYIQQNFFERNIIALKELNEDNTCTVTIRETCQEYIEKWMK